MSLSVNISGIIQIILAGIIFSFYYFPFAFYAFPAYNTKTIMALGGFVLLFINYIRYRKHGLSRKILGLIFWALIVSFCGLLSITINETNDTTYAMYVRSMSVWMSAAYFACLVIKKVHGYIDVELVARYLIGVCACQCVIVLMIEFVPWFKNIVDTYIMMGQARMEVINRLYGIGVALDVGGSRMAVALVVAVYYIERQLREHRFPIYYILCFALIAVVGNMVARTTSVGLGVSAVYLFLLLKPWRNISNTTLKLAIPFILICCALGLFIVYLYKTNAEVNSLLRFAFESLFNYFEKGSFETASTNVLKNMIKFPDNAKTWIIGDGYFTNPNFTEPTYIGDAPAYGYYMDTDSGYCRFIFYFGLLGLAAFIIYMIYATSIPVTNNPKDKAIFVMILLCNMIIWIKVSTDVFLAMALFICVSQMCKEKINAPIIYEDTV